MKAIKYCVMENEPAMQVFRSVSIVTKSIEPAGLAFSKFIRKLRKLSGQQIKIEEEVLEESDKNEIEKIKKYKLKNYKELDYYEILDIKDRLDANSEILKINYKKLALIFHPDKT